MDTPQQLKRAMKRNYLRPILLICAVVAGVQFCWVYAQIDIPEFIQSARNTTGKVIFAIVLLQWPLILIAIWYRLLQLRKSGLHALALFDAMVTIAFVYFGIRQPEDLHVVRAITIALSAMLPYHVALVCGFRHRHKFT